MKKASKTIKEAVTIELLVRTPTGVTKAEVMSVFGKAAWAMDIELAYDIQMKSMRRICVDESPNDEVDTSGLEWNVEIDAEVALTPGDDWYDDDYDASDTIQHISAEPVLPDEWEVLSSSLSGV